MSTSVCIGYKVKVVCHSDYIFYNSSCFWTVHVNKSVALYHNNNVDCYIVTLNMWELHIFSTLAQDSEIELIWTAVTSQKSTQIMLQSLCERRNTTFTVEYRFILFPFLITSVQINSTFTTCLNHMDIMYTSVNFLCIKIFLYAYVDICQSVYIALHENGGQTLQTLALYNTNTGIRRWECKHWTARVIPLETTNNLFAYHLSTILTSLSLW